MQDSERMILRRRYDFSCAYCGTTEVDAGGELTVDHFQPRSHEGPDTRDNWVYACSICNGFKGHYWKPDSVQRILHPLRDNLAEHIQKGEDGRLVPLTETGRFHVERLQLNRPQLVIQRLHNRELEELRQRLRHLENENVLLRRHNQEVEGQIALLMEELEL